MHLHCHLEVCCHTPVQPAAYKQHSEKDRINGLHADSSKVKPYGNSSTSFFSKTVTEKKSLKLKANLLSKVLLCFCLFVLVFNHLLWLMTEVHFYSP